MVTPNKEEKVLGARNPTVAEATALLEEMLGPYTGPKTTRYCDVVAHELPYDENAKALQRLFQIISGWDDVDGPSRDIWVTPARGQYERIASYTIAVNGSPFRGQIFVTQMESQFFGNYTDFRSPGRLKSLKAKQLEVVLRFLSANGYGKYGVNHQQAVCRVPDYAARMAAREQKSKSP